MEMNWLNLSGTFASEIDKVCPNLRFVKETRNIRCEILTANVSSKEITDPILKS